ncbi:MAG: bifunctional N-acetylglucosamine-1-phosphate uridyltransferase/glucosamine-1-phosphate acetyltransferase [Deltaproteobacteria bacterium]|nr:bifunctional N-acetylglucosamine-1-phosphate uridyltransferase/glucosamine-1-phosphate acetyltransferase [Deltaproteobacteria bacterium]
MHNICTVILAAGKGTRMKSKRPKVMHEILGFPLIYYTIKLARKVSNSIVVVIGYGKEHINTYLDKFELTKVVQEPQLGTGHALLQTRDVLESTDATDAIILPGDMPLIKNESIGGLLDVYQDTGSNMGILTAVLQNPYGYGRIIRDEDGHVTSIVEELDATPDQKRISEINTGVYIIKRDFLLDALPRLSAKNAKGEFYLTDIVGMTKHAISFNVASPDEAYGINSRRQLSHAATIMQQRINDNFMDDGITIIAPKVTWISPTATIACDVEIWPNVHILGVTKIEHGVKIMPGVWITDSNIGRGSIIGNNSVIENSAIKSGSIIEPYSYINPACPRGRHNQG